MEAGDPPEELRSLPPDMVAGPRLPDTFLGTATPLHFPPSPFPSSTGPGPHYLSGPLPPGTYSGPTQLIQPRAPGPAAMPVAPGPALYPAPAYTPELGLVPRSSPQHGVVSSPYVGVGPAPPVAGVPSAPPPQFSGPELTMVVRPATTTVDSIQAPIPSHTAPRPNPTTAPPQPRFPVPPPQSLPTPYTYPVGTKQPVPAQHHFSPGIPAGFQPRGLGPSPSPILHEHLGLNPHSSPFHSSIHTSSHPRPQDSYPHSPPTPMPLSLGFWGSRQPPCTPSSTQVLLKTLCQPCRHHQ